MTTSNTSLLTRVKNGARRTGQASLGLLGMGFEFATKRLSKRRAQASELVTEAVSRGETITDDVTSTIKSKSSDVVKKAKADTAEIKSNVDAVQKAVSRKAKAASTKSAKPNAAKAKASTSKTTPSEKAKSKTTKSKTPKAKAPNAKATSAKTANTKTATGKSPKAKAATSTTTKSDASKTKQAKTTSKSASTSETKTDDIVGTEKYGSYVEKVQNYDKDADPVIVKAIVDHLGIALQSRDSMFVACSDETERRTVAQSWLSKKLGIESDDATLDEKVGAVCDTMKADRMKDRVTFYYLAAKQEKKLDKLIR